MRRQHFREQVSNLAADPGGKDKLHQQKNVVLVAEMRIQSYYVWMVQSVEDF